MVVVSFNKDTRREETCVRPTTDSNLRPNVSYVLTTSARRLPKRPWTPDGS